MNIEKQTMIYPINEELRVKLETILQKDYADEWSVSIKELVTRYNRGKQFKCMWGGCEETAFYIYYDEDLESFRFAGQEILMEVIHDLYTCIKNYIDELERQETISNVVSFER